MGITSIRNCGKAGGDRPSILQGNECDVGSRTVFVARVPGAGLGGEDAMGVVGWVKLGTLPTPGAGFERRALKKKEIF